MSISGRANSEVVAIIIIGFILAELNDISCGVRFKDSIELNIMFM